MTAVEHGEKTRMKLSSLILAGMLAVSTNASAAIVTYFGLDNSPSFGVPVGGNAETARNDFLSQLVGVGSEDFESQTVGNTGPFSIDFAGSTGNITATLAGTSLDLRNSSTSGTYATSGSRFIRAITDTSATSFTIDFSTSVAAFGFFGTDLGDAGGGDLVLNLTNGTSQEFTIDVDGSASGNLMFFGFVSDSDTFSSISFANTAGSGDFWGFDDMIVGDLGQVQTEVSAPGSLLLLGMGLFGLALRRKNRA